MNFDLYGFLFMIILFCIFSLNGESDEEMNWNFDFLDGNRCILHFLLI